MWRCDKRQCKVIATTFEGNVFTTREHLYEPDIKHLAQQNVLQMLKNKAANSNEQSKKMLQDATASDAHECAVERPKYKRVSRSNQRQRGWEKTPTTLKDVAFPWELQFKLRGEDFLAYDSGSEYKEKVLNLGTDQNLDLLESTLQWHADGTFI